MEITFEAFELILLHIDYFLHDGLYTPLNNLLYELCTEE